jgi:hypothetical protein
MYHVIHWTGFIVTYIYLSGFKLSPQSTGVESISIALNAVIEWLSLPDVQEDSNHGLETGCSDRVFMVVCSFRQMLG